MNCIATLIKRTVTNPAFAPKANLVVVPVGAYAGKTLPKSERVGQIRIPPTSQFIIGRRPDRIRLCTARKLATYTILSYYTPYIVHTIYPVCILMSRVMKLHVYNHPRVSPPHAYDLIICFESRTRSGTLFSDHRNEIDAFANFLGLVAAAAKTRRQTNHQPVTNRQIHAYLAPQTKESIEREVFALLFDLSA